MTRLPLPHDDEYRRAIVKAFGKAEQARYDQRGLCTLCQEPEHSCPGWHAPEVSSFEDEG